jgi:hypothetical protein
LQVLIPATIKRVKMADKNNENRTNAWKYLMDDGEKNLKLLIDGAIAEEENPSVESMTLYDFKN